MDEDNGERGAGFFEKFYFCRSVNGYGSTVNMTAKYNHRVNDILLSNALRSYVMKNSRIYANFFTSDSLAEMAENNGSNILLKSVSQIRYEEVVKTVQLETTFNDETVDELNQIELRVNDDSPMWKLFIHENKDEQYVTFCFNHCLFDGNSGKHFHEDFLRELESFSKQENLKFITVLYDEKIDREIRPPLPTDTDDIVNFYKSGKLFKWKALLNFFFTPQWVEKPIKITRKKLPNVYKYPIFQTFPTRKESRTKYKLMKILPEDLKLILQRCKAEKFTLTPYITSVAMYALQEKIFPHWGCPQSSFHIMIAVDGRRYLPKDQPNIRYGLCIAGIDAFFGPFFGEKFKQIGKVAMQIHDTILKEIESRNPFKFAGLLRLINVWDYFNGKVGKKNRETISVSNLGMCNVSYDYWAIKDLIFSQSNGIYSHFGISSISTAEGGLNICMGYLEEDNKTVDGKEIIDNFVQFYKECLLEVSP